MSLINEYRATEEAIKELQARLKNLSQDDMLDPESKVKAPRGAVKTTGTKRARKVKQYKNPHNGEVIETKGGNHKTLKEWKAKWGGDVVEGWATLLG